MKTFLRHLRHTIVIITYSLLLPTLFLTHPSAVSALIDCGFADGETCPEGRSFCTTAYDESFCCSYASECWLLASPDENGTECIVIPSNVTFDSLTCSSAGTFYNVSCDTASTNYCCTTATACSAQDGEVLTSENDPNTPHSARQACDFTENPEECKSLITYDKKIPTALGDIPYEYSAFVVSFLGFAIGLAGGIALVIMLVGAYYVLTGGNNPEAVKRGKEVFSGALTGLLFIIFSVVMLRIIAGDIIQIPGFN